MDNIFGFFILGGFFFIICFGFFYWLTYKLRKYLKNKYIPLRAAYFKCLDGHVVKSRGELIIDNYLYRLAIEHDYENAIRIRGKSLKYDWYLPKFKLYIEYWGYFGKKYMKRKEEKLDLYQKGKLKLISIEDIMLQDIYVNLDNQLAKYIKFEEKGSNQKFCPNCGILLDNRF